MADAPISEELTTLKKRARRRLVGAIAMVLVALVALWTVMDDKPPQSLATQPVAIVSSEPALSSTVAALPKPAVAPTPAPSTPKPNSAAPPTVAATPPPVVPVPVTVPIPNPAPVAAHATPTPAPAVSSTNLATKPIVADSKPANKSTHADTPVKKPEPTATPVTKPAAVAPKSTDPAKILAGMDDTSNAKHADKPHPADAAAGHFFVQLGAFADSDKAHALVAKAGAAGVTVQDIAVQTDKGELTRLRAGPYSSREAAEHALGKLSAAGVSGSVVGK